MEYWSRARDGRSRIHDVALSVDDGPFRPLSPADGIFDSRQENFEGRLPKLDAGRHRVVLRVRDASGNIQSAARTARTGP